MMSPPNKTTPTLDRVVGAAAESLHTHSTKARVALSSPPVAWTQDAKGLFVRGIRRRSTAAVAEYVWAALRDHPHGAALNVSQAARELSLSRLTVRRALTWLTAWGRLFVVDDHATGDGHPGRPVAYRLHPAYVKADRIGVSAKRGNLPHTPTDRSETSLWDLKATEDRARASSLARNDENTVRLRETSHRNLREVVREIRRLSLKAGEGSVARTLGALREALETWTVSGFLAEGISLADALDSPEGVLADLKSEIHTALAVALWRQRRQGTYLAAWNDAHDELIRRIAYLPEEDPETVDRLVGALDPNEGRRQQVYAFCGHLVAEVFGELELRVQGELARLRRDESKRRARIESDRDRLTEEQACEVLARARGSKPAREGRQE